MFRALLPILALALATPAAFAAPQKDPLKDCPYTDVLRYAEVSGGIYQVVAGESKEIQKIRTSIPVYGSFMGKCQRIPDPGQIGDTEIKVDGRVIRLDSSAYIREQSVPYNGDEPAKWFHVVTWAVDSAPGEETKSYTLISGRVGSPDLGVKSLRTEFEGRLPHAPANRISIVLRLDDSSAPETK